jgi:hypothetical protein
VFRVVYVSSASSSFSTENLRQLLETARRANEAAEITRMLVYRKGEFLQALEGPSAAVRDTFARIEGDQRHLDIVQLQRGDASQLFSNWAMGFSDLDCQAALAGFVQVNDRLNLRRLDEMVALDFLTASAAAQLDQ